MRRLVALLCLWGLAGCSGEPASEALPGSDVSQSPQSASTTAKIPITAAMVRLDPARPAKGNYSTAFDEQALAGDPLLGTGGKPLTNWNDQSWVGSDYPAGFYIDLGEEYVITHVAYFDTFNTDAVYFDTGSPGQWTRQVTSQSTGWEQWRIFPITATTRYVQYTRAMFAGVNEILLYGYPSGGTEPPNQPPVASISPPQPITLPTASATLSGGGSDPDGTISSWLWTQVSGPNTAALSGAATATASVSGLVAGTYRFRLTVTDNEGASATAEATLVVNPAPPTGPVPYGVQSPLKSSSTKFGTRPPFGYYEYLPSQYDADPTKKWPLIIMLHGLGQRGNGESELTRLLDTGLTRQIQEGTFKAHDKFLVMSPQFIWYDTPNIRSFLNFIKAHYRVDLQRMYLTGLSLGGIAAWDYVNENGTAVEFAAVAPIAGNGCWGGAVCEQFQSVPLWAFHGEDDSNSPTAAHYDISSYLRIKNCSVPAREIKLTLYPGVDHDSWSMTYSLSGMQRQTHPSYDPYDVDLYTWFLQHTK